MTMTQNTLTPEQQKLQELWQKHTYAEFANKNVEEALDTMTDDAYVTCVPVMTGGVGKEGVREFYGQYFVNQLSDDIELVPISQTISNNQLVDEFIVKFTHDRVMDWILPGVPATGKKVEIPAVGIIGFEGDKLVHERLYWDQASVLVQIGLLDPSNLPVAGVETAHKILDHKLPNNQLIHRKNDIKPIVG